MANREEQDTPPPAEGEVTRLLREVDMGAATAVDRLLPLVYDELHALATRAFRDKRGGHTLQPTAIVHDAYLKLVGHAGSLNDRSHFYVLASKAMRQMLTDHVRKRGAAKHGGAWHRVSLYEIGLEEQADDDELVALDSALTVLTEIAPRQAKIVELRFFAGLEVKEVASILEVSPRTVVAEWRTARAFLRSKVKEGA